MQDFQIKDTTQVQIQSVVSFMGALGFIPDLSSKKLSFVNQRSVDSAAQRIKFGTAVKLHNTTLEDWKILGDSGMAFCEKYSNVALCWDVPGVAIAHAAKLVEKVKVSITRKGFVIMNNENAHLVRTANQAITQMIG